MRITFACHMMYWLLGLTMVFTRPLSAQRHDAWVGTPKLDRVFHELRQTDVVLPCDTWVALGDATKSSHTLLAKNSDRTLFDCQPLLLHPRRDWPEGATIELGRLTIPQVRQTHATLGSSPYWCWGYEQGINEHAVAIGNEGIRTKVLAADLAALERGDPPTPGPTGMDLLRLALERAASAEEAVAVITGLLEQYGQFGSGLPAMQAREGAYENSFIIADPHEAWVLETAGRQWVARRFTRGTTSISNTLTIGKEWDLCSERVEAYAIEQGWWTPEQQEQDHRFDFTTAYLDDAAERQAAEARSVIRQRRSSELLHFGKRGQDSIVQDTAGAVSAIESQPVVPGAITPQWMMRIARDRNTSPGLDLDQTASSCVAILPPAGIPVFWWCPATPSNSCYVPFFVLGSQLPEFVSTAGTVGRTITAPSQVPRDRFAEGSYWWQFRDLCNKVRANYAERNPQVRAVFDPLEQQFAAGLPQVLERAFAARSAGNEAKASAALDQYSARCAQRALDAAKQLREQFAGEPVTVPDQYQPYVGNYLATIKRDTVEVLVQNDHLAVALPGRGVLELKQPDAAGKWYFALTDQAAISFDRDDVGIVVGMKLHQAGLAFELVREGVELPPEIELDKLQPYLGSYHHGPSNSDVKVFIQNNRLAVDWPARQVIFELHPPDAADTWAFRLDKASAVRFQLADDGTVQSMDHLRGGEVETNLPRVEDDS